MPVADQKWAAYKQQVLAAAGDFSCVYGTLKKQRRYGDGKIRGCCPLHDDNEPSFAYDTTTGRWACFTDCGGGSVFDFLMIKSGRDFKGVLVDLGTKLGIPPPGKGTENTPRHRYEYQDENGDLLFQVLRGPGKKFTQRRPDGKGGWVWNLKGVRRVLYRLPELAVQREGSIFIVEGEKDVDRLYDEGISATTNPGGAGKWRKNYGEHLAGRDVVIVPDNDVTGGDHARRVAEALSGSAASVRILELPDLTEKGDVSDWLGAEHTAQELQNLADATPEWQPDSDVVSAGSIIVNGRQLRDVVADAWRAVHAASESPSLFIRTGKLLRLVDTENGPRIERVTEDAAHGHLVRVVDWAKQGQNGLQDAKPTRDIAKDFIANPDPGLPILESVVSSPVFDASGQLIIRPGYHQSARLWYHQAKGADVPIVPSAPTAEDMERAVALIREELLVDFPFVDESDEAHAIAALLLPFIRRIVSGPTPIHLIEAPVPGSGKSLLADLISIVALGRPCEPTTVSYDENENRKKITAILGRGTPIVLLDNVGKSLDSAQLASALTADTWSDRLLGKSVMVEYPNRATWLVTANNPKLSLEIVRRCVRIRLDSGEDRPWQRGGFKHDPIREWARRDRMRLVHACLVIVRSWIAAERPLGKKKLGSFEDWSAVVGGILHHAGVTAFLENMDEFYEAADPEGQEWRAFVEAWWGAHDDQWVSASELVELAENESLLGFVLGDKSDRSKKIRLGKALNTARDRTFGDYKLCVGTRSHSKTAQYRLSPIVEEKGVDGQDTLPFLRDVAGCEKSHHAPHPAEQQEGVQ